MTRRTAAAASASLALLTAAVALAVALAAAPASDRRVVIGRSVRGRPLLAVRAGDPHARHHVLVVGCVHGSERAGIAIVRRLASVPAVPAGVLLTLVERANPDGAAAGTRGNARGVDLNRNASVGWRPLGPPGSTYYAGRGPFSEPETRALAALIRRERPELVVWYHQALDVVDVPERGARTLARRYARAAGMRLRPLGARPGSMSRWTNVRVRSGSSFAVELPAGRLPARAADRHARAVLAVAGSLARPR